MTQKKCEKTKKQKFDFFGFSSMKISFFIVSILILFFILINFVFIFGCGLVLSFRCFTTFTDLLEVQTHVVGFFMRFPAYFFFDAKKNIHLKGRGGGKINTHTRGKKQFSKRGEKISPPPLLNCEFCYFSWLLISCSTPWPLAFFFNLPFL